MSSDDLLALGEGRLSTYESSGKVYTITGPEAAASLRAINPQIIVGKRVMVTGRGAGTVLAAVHSFGHASRHKIAFDDGSKAILSLQKKGAPNAGREEFELLEDDTAGAEGLVGGTLAKVGLSLFRASMSSESDLVFTHGKFAIGFQFSTTAACVYLAPT
jgi:hypothetical protein